MHESFSSEGERNEVEDVPEPVRIHMSINDSEDSEPVVDFERSVPESEPESLVVSEHESLVASEPEPIPESEHDSVPESVPEVNALNSSSDSDSDKPVRRSSRARTSRRMLTYDTLGIPLYE